MRFSAFFRYHTTPGTIPAGAANALLNSDVAPSPTANGSTTPTYPPSQPLASLDNLLVVPNTSSQGASPQKIAVGYGWVGSGSAPATTATLYVLEEATGLWFVVGTAATALVPGGLVFFDALSVPDFPPLGGGQVPGQIFPQVNYKAPAQRYLLVPACGSPTTGQWYFAWSSVLTISP
jgi:hypothetical protein